MVQAQTGNTIHSPGGFPADSFWGRTDHVEFQAGAPDNEYHSVSIWGPSTGWFMSLSAGIFAVLTPASVVLARPRPVLRQLRLPAAVSVIIAICLVGSAVALYPVPVHEEPPGRLGGLRVEAVDNGDWRIYVISGNIKPSAVDIQITNPSSGAEMLRAHVSSGTAGNPDFFWNDSNQNDKVDAGDDIVLKGTVNGQPNPDIQPGFKVQFLRGDTIIGTIKELPPH
jgi:hypothetical protein